MPRWATTRTFIILGVIMPSLINFPGCFGWEKRGGGSSDYIEGLPDKLLWLRADAGITKDGSNIVTEWVDQSSNAYSFVPNPTGPTWTASAYGSLPAIRYTGTEGLLSSANIASATFYNSATQYTMYAVFNPAATAGAGVQSVLSDAPTPHIELYRTSNGTTWTCYGYNGTTEAKPDATLTNSTLQTLTVTHNGTTDKRSYVNDVHQNTDSVVGNPTTQGLKIGIGAGRTSAYEPFKGDIQEIIFFSGVHSAATQTAVHNALKAKWGY